ncbi:MAG: molybdate ABC transporter substrate-binding protein [Pirellulaceae bacterium]
MMRDPIALCLLGLVGILAGCGERTRTAPPPAAAKGASQTRLDGSPASSERTRLTVAAAADLRFVLAELLTKFHEAHPSVTAEVTYGSSGRLYAQVENGAPFDIFLSADIQFPSQLGEGGQADPTSVFPYAVGHLVIWVPNTSDLNVEKLGMRAVLDERVKKVAIANPKVAPYGRAAEAAMKHLGVYEAAKEKLVLGENVSQAAQFVESGGADVGIIALSLAMAPSMQGKGRFRPVPADAYPQLLQGGVILNAGRERAAADQLRSFLTSEPARHVYQHFGFESPP